MRDVSHFESQLVSFSTSLSSARRVLITAPGVADGDSVGSQLALRQMLRHRFPKLEIFILNDEPLPPRYRFMPGADEMETPETFAEKHLSVDFDVAIIVDGGIDRSGRVKEIFDRSRTKVFIDHHAVSVEYPYTIRIVEPNASSTTELIYHLSQTRDFKTPLNREFCQQIYLGIVFDTGFFRHSNTTPEVMELAALLMRAKFDFTLVGERGMLVRSFPSLKLLAEVLAKAELAADGKIVYSCLSQDQLKSYGAVEDDREGIIDHLFLTEGIEVAVLFIELADKSTKVSFRSQGGLDVATFARSITVRGGGHRKAAGANLDMDMLKAVDLVLRGLENTLQIKGR